MGLEALVERRRRQCLRALEEAREFATKVAGLLGRVLVVLHGSYVHGGFHEDSDFDIIIVSPAFEGIRPLDRASLPRSILPARVEVICWTPGELR